MNDKLNIDKTIREKLDDFSVAPPSHVWDNIQGQMAAQQRKKRFIYVSWIAAAALVVFAFVAGWVLNEQTEALLPETVEQTIVQPTEEEDKTTDRIAGNESAVEDELFVSTKSLHLNSFDANSKKEVNSVFESNEVNGENSFVASVERISYDLLESIEAIFNTKQSTVYLVEYQQQSSELDINAFDEILIAENIKNTKKHKNSNDGWKVGTLISPGYASHSSSHSDSYAQNMTYSGSNGSANVGAGFSVQYKTTKRLRVESGVYYSQNGQNSNNSGQDFFSFNNKADYMMAAPNDVADVAPGFSNTIQLSSNGISMNSTAGVINMRSAPKGAMVATNAESINAVTENTLTTSGEFLQVFQFVEVPLYLRYSVIDKKFGVEVLGGINAGMVVGNNAYIDNEYGKQNVGSTNDISTLNLSGTIGVGMNYALGKHFSLALEPRLNYFLNSINSNPDVDFRPYRVGIFTGVYYEF